MKLHVLKLEKNINELKLQMVSGPYFYYVPEILFPSISIEICEFIYLIRLKRRPAVTR
jgi:hypothetical protein